MEAAGRAVATFCLRQYAGVSQVGVLCGKGNNGGDGLVAARVLAQAGLRVYVVLLGRKDEVKGEAAVSLRRLREEVSSVIVDEVVDEAGLEIIAPMLGEAGLLIDAVVGTGFKPPLRGVAASVRELLELVDVPVVAVDLPSGWDANSMEQKADGAFRADAVVTFTAPKMAHVFGNLTRNEKTGGAFGTGRCGSDRVSRGCGGFCEWADMDGGFQGTGGEAQGCELQQGQVWARAGGGGELWEGRGSGDGVAGVFACGCGIGYGSRAEEHRGYGDADYA